MTQTPFGNPNGAAPTDLLDNKSIVDNVLDLDAFLSADVRRAERMAWFSTKPDLEADIESLHATLEGLTDQNGRPVEEREASVAGGPSEANAVAQQIADLQQEYSASMKGIRMRQLDSDSWDEFLAHHKKTLDAGAPYPSEFYDDLISQSAHRPSMSVDQVKQLRKKVGNPQMEVLANVAWDVNTKSGVSIPKSPLSSAVLRRQERSQN